MKPRLIPIIAGIILGIVSALLVHGYLAKERQALRALQTDMNVQDVLIAKQNIDQGAILSEEMVEVQGVPERFIQPHALTKPSVVNGKVAIAPIAKGEQVLRSKLSLPGTQTTMLAAKIPPGKRAVTLIFDPIAAVGGFVQPGNDVDILWTTYIPQPNKTVQTVTLTIIQQALVLGVSDQLSPAAPAAEPSKDKRDKSPAPSTASSSRRREGLPVTFAVTPEEMELLLFAQEQGKLQLAVRPQSEGEGTAETVAPSVSLDELRSLVFGSQQGPTPAPQREVEVYRGLEKVVVAVPEALSQ